MNDEIGTINAHGNKLFLFSRKNAPNGKILMMDLDNPDIKKAVLVAPEKDIPLEAGDGLTPIEKFSNLTVYEKTA
jgi:hypothetical protein